MSTQTPTNLPLPLQQALDACEVAKRQMQEAREVLSVTEIAFAYHQTDAVDLDAARADFMRCEANSQQSNRRYWEIKDELEAQTRPVPPVRQQSPTSRPGSTRPQSKAQATRPATVTTRPQATVSAGRR